MDNPYSFRISCRGSCDDPVETLEDAIFELRRIVEEGVCREPHVIEVRRGDTWRVLSDSER